MMMMMMLLLLLLLIDVSSLKRQVLITGGTGVLGNALVKSLTLSSPSTSTSTSAFSQSLSPPSSLLSSPSSSTSSHMTIYVGYRNIHKLQELHNNDPILLHKNNDAITICPTNINLDDDDIDLSFLNNDSDELILINNAAVFINGNDYEAMMKSFKYNCIKPAHLCTEIISRRSTTLKDLTIINISSGDGELVYLNTEIRKEIKNIKSIDEWYAYIDRTQQLYNNKIEYAYGDTPFYSLSKALLNSYTQILDRESPEWCKVVSICPGNFESSMSTTDEENTFKDPLVAAEGILKVSLNANKYQGGKFYRYGEEIEY